MFWARGKQIWKELKQKCWSLVNNEYLEREGNHETEVYVAFGEMDAQGNGPMGKNMHEEAILHFMWVQENGKTHLGRKLNYDTSTLTTLGLPV